MDYTSQHIEEDPAPAILHPFLDFVALCLEDPVRAATRAAMALSLLAVSITLIAMLFGAVAGAGLGLVYVVSGWALPLYLARRQDRA